MAKIDKAAKAFFEKPEIYADVINIVFYKGEPVVSEDNIVELDPSEGVKQRDLLRRVRAGKNHRLHMYIGLEIQCYHDDIMPVRSFGYDIRRYEHQLRNLKNRKQLVFDTDQKHLILKKRTDPVVTVTVSLCREKWKGNTNLLDMTGVKDMDIRKLIPDPRLLLLDPYTMEDALIDKCRSELKYVLYLVKYRKNVKKYKELMKRLEGVELSQEAINVLRRTVGIRMKVKKDEKGGTIMYEAQEMLIEEEKDKVRKQYEKEAVKQAKETEKERKAKEKAQKEKERERQEKIKEREEKVKAQKEKEKERKAKEAAEAEAAAATKRLVSNLYQMVTEGMMSKAEAIRRSQMSAYRFMKFVKTMNL